MATLAASTPKVRSRSLPVEDKVGLRVAGTYVNSDPYVKNRLAAGLNTWAAFGLSGLNRNTGLNPGGTESYGIRATLRFKPSDSLDVTLKGYYAKATGGTETPLADRPVDDQ